MLSNLFYYLRIYYLFKINNKMMNQYQTGDLIFYHGTKSCIDKIIECCSSSKYSHVSMVIIIPNPAFLNTELIPGTYVIESGVSDAPDPTDGKMKFGVHLTRMEDVLAEKGQIHYHKIIDCNRDSIFYENLKKAYNKVYDIPYDLDPFDWINAAEFSWCHFLNCYNRQRKDKFWCSALVAYILVQLNILPSDTPWTDLSPKDLAYGSNINFINCNVNIEQQI